MDYKQELARTLSLHNNRVREAQEELKDAKLQCIKFTASLKRNSKLWKEVSDIERKR